MYQSKLDNLHAIRDKMQNLLDDVETMITYKLNYPATESNSFFRTSMKRLDILFSAQKTLYLSIADVDILLSDVNSKIESVENDDRGRSRERNATPVHKTLSPIQE